MPGRHGIAADRNVVDAIAPLGVGRGVERVAEHQHEGAHVRVNLAEHPHDARAIEPYGLRLAARVAAQVELPCLRQREHVVVGAVVVRKVDERPGVDGEDVRQERFVALVHPRPSGVSRLERRRRCGLQVDDRTPGVRRLARARRAEVGDARPALGRRHHAPDLDAAADGAERPLGRRGYGAQHERHREARSQPYRPLSHVKTSTTSAQPRNAPARRGRRRAHSAAVTGARRDSAARHTRRQPRGA